MGLRLPAVTWRTLPLSEVAEIHTGVAKGAKSIRSPVLLPYLRVANVQAGSLDLSEIKTIVIDQKDIRRYSLLAGDVLMTEGGDFDKLGRGAIWTGEIDPCLHQNHVFALRCDRQRLLPEWLSWVAPRSYGRRYFMLCSKQSTNLASINSSQLKAFPIPLPSLEQQSRIAETMRTIEAYALQVQELLTAKRLFSRGLTQELLSGMRRAPEFRTSPWHFSQLGNHVKPVVRRNGSTTTMVLTASGEHGLVDQRRYFNRSVAGSDLSRYYLMKNGEFAYNRSAMKGYPYGATKRLDQHEIGSLSTLYLCFGISDSKLDSDYLKHVFDSGILNRQLRPIVRVGARAHGLLNVSDEDYLSISIPFPSFEEQQRIACLLNDLNREIGLLQAKLTQIAIYKRGVFANALDGGIVVQ